MNEIQEQRLIQMGNHLLHGDLGHERFDFRCYNRGYTKEQTCGTNGCAVGELPVLFPESWEFVSQYVRIKDSDNKFVWEDVEDWYGIKHEEAYHLFMSSVQLTALYGGELLDEDATKEQVANNIFAFLKKKDSNFEIPQPESKPKEILKYDVELVMNELQEVT